jgi:hypothetical protein
MHDRLTKGLCTSINMMWVTGGMGAWGPSPPSLQTAHIMPGLTSIARLLALRATSKISSLAWRALVMMASSCWYEGLPPATSNFPTACVMQCSHALLHEVSGFRATGSEGFQLLVREPSARYVKVFHRVGHTWQPCNPQGITTSRMRFRITCVAVLQQRLASLLDRLNSKKVFGANFEPPPACEATAPARASNP